jgi:multiple sugar transport system substrate-binding protein
LATLVGGGAALAACTQATSTTAPQEEAPADEETPQEEAPSGEVVEVSWWNPDVLEWQPSYQGIADMVMANNPNIKVAVGNVPEAEFANKITAMIAANDAPDVWTWYYSTDTARHGFIQELDDLMKGSGVDGAKQWFPICSLRSIYLGKTYGTPRDGVWTAVIYNQDLFDEFGVTYPEDGWTTDDYLEKAKGTTDEAKGTWGTMAGGPGSLSWDVGFCWNLHFEIVSEDGRQVKGLLDSEDSIWAIQWMIDLQDKWKVSPPSGMTQSLGDYPFGSGLVGMADGHAWGFDSIKALTFKFDQLTAPVKPGVSPQAWGDSVQYYMWTGSEHKDEAFEVQKTASSVEGSKIPMEAGHWTAPCPETWLALEADKDHITGPWWIEAQKPTQVPNYLRTEYHFDCVFPEFEGVWTRYIENGERPLDRLVQEAADAAQKCLDERYAESES